MTDSLNHEVIIIGGGACGCLIAYFLRDRGVDVAVVDSGPVGQEASWASAGMVGPESCPQRDPWFVKSTTLARQQYDQLDSELFEQTGQRIGYGGQGHLVIARQDAEVVMLEEKIQQQQAGGIEAHLLSGQEARQREPAIPKDVIAGAWVPDGRYLDARQFTAVVAQAAKAKGAVLYENQRVTGLVWKAKRVMGVRIGDQMMLADKVINAAGAWAGSIDPLLTHPVYPFHGQIMAVQGLPCGLRHNVSRVGGGYATPRDDGRVIVGATHEDFGFEKKITPQGIEHLGKIVERVLPDWVDQPVLDIWSGFRPGSPDGLPTIGIDPRTEGDTYFWATGQSASGMMQMPAIALVLVDLVMGCEPCIEIDALSVKRYFTQGQTNLDLQLNQFMMV